VTVLPHEIERWDTGGESFVWVRVPRIDADSTADHIWLYYGNPDAVDVQDPTGAWNGFAAVYHFREGAIAIDSSGGAHHGDVVGSAGVDAAGRIAGSLQLSGSGNLHLTGTAEISAGAGEQRTIEVWFKTGHIGSQYVLSQEVFCRGYGIQMGAQPDQLFRGRLFATNAPNCTGIEQYYAHTGGNAFSDDKWHYAALVIDRSQQLTMRLYVDGGEVGSTVVSPSTNAVSEEAWIGSSINNQSRFQGEIDEVRVSRFARSEGWIDAQLRSMSGDLTKLEDAEHLP
jgi:hypothetical protein